jgi:hypothetical protein
MKRLSMTVALALVAHAANAQPNKVTPMEPKPVAPADEMSPPDVALWLAFFDKLVDAVVLDAQTCDKMAIDVSTVIDTNRASIELARTARAKGKKLPKVAQEHMIDGVRKMGPGIENCAENARVKAAFAKLEVTAPDKSEKPEKPEKPMKPAKPGQ